MDRDFREFAICRWIAISTACDFLMVRDSPVTFCQSDFVDALFWELILELVMFYDLGIALLFELILELLLELVSEVGLICWN